MSDQLNDFAHAPESGSDAVHKALAIHRQNRERFCGLPGRVKPDHPEVVAAAQRLLQLARLNSGASEGAGRILYACYSAHTAVNIDDFLNLDPYNFRAAMIVLNFALFEGCERILQEDDMRWLRQNFEVTSI